MHNQKTSKKRIELRLQAVRSMYYRGSSKKSRNKTFLSMSTQDHGSSLPDGLARYAQAARSHPEAFMEGCVVLHKNLSICGKLPRRVFQNVAASKADVKAIGHTCRPLFGKDRIVSVCGPSKPAVHLAAADLFQEYAPIVLQGQQLDFERVHAYVASNKK